MSEYGISIDPSFVATGIAIWDGQDYAGGETIKPPTGESGMLAMLEAIMLYIDYQQIKPGWIAIEPAYLGKNARTTMKLSELIGALKWVFYDKFDTAIYVAASVAQIDKACGVPVGLPRKERKRRIAAQMSILCGAGKQQDEYDAALVGMWALAVRNSERLRALADDQDAGRESGA